MDSLEGPVAAVADDVSSPPSPPPPEPSAALPVDSPVHALDDARASPSDDDRDHDHDHDYEHDLGGDQDQAEEQEPPAVPVEGEAAGTGGLTEDLKRRIVKQVEYYFSDENLPTDKHMISLIRKNKEGFVPIPVIASFRKMKKLIRDHASIVTALRESTFLVVSSDGKKVKRLHPFPFAAIRDSKLYTVLVENLPEDHSVGNIRRIFDEAGKIKNICIQDPHAIEESSKVDKSERFISSKLHALVEYETIEAAEKAVATLNNEQDWRSGMRVKLLKRAARHGQKKPTWRGPDPEKNHACRPDRSGDEGNHKSSEHEHHDDMPDEEDGAHLQKEKNEQRGRNRGRSGRHKHRGGANGMGHGTTWSSHPHEPPKPPPGPRMPDGTRGFTMGRGRPPTSDQS